MKGTSSVLEGVIQSLPRRRLKQKSPSISLFPSVDLIGPPCPLSNLRPVYYAPLFPSLPSTPSFLPPSSSSSSSSPHPYSLAEFPLAPSSSRNPSSDSTKLARLTKVQQDLHAKDLEYRLTRYRLDAFNQHFWSKTNADFLKSRDAYLIRVGTVAQPTATATEVDLSPFYREHLEKNKKIYAKYNSQLWAMQAALLWPALKAVWRPWKWRWELWKAGGGGEQQAKV